MKEHRIAQQEAEGAEDEKSRWQFMAARTIGDGQTTYMKRLCILTTPWFSIKLHRIFRKDGQRDLHDHPWNFLSIILRGFYREDTVDGIKERRWLNFKRAEDRHSIRYVSRSPVWTLVVTGRRRRRWGFWVKYREPWPLGLWRERWIDFEEYDKLNDA